MTATLLLIYSLISGTVLTVLWATFRLSGMKSLTHHRLNRALLVGILLASVIFPIAAFIERPAEPAEPIIVNVAIGEIAPVATVPITETTPAPVGPSKEQIIAVVSTIYIIGAGASALWLLIGLGNIFVAIAKGERRKLDRTTTLVIHNRNIVPFTWGRWIVISRSDLGENGDVLLCHERAHKSAAHWADLLLSRAVTCIDWYWPSAWLLTRDLAAVHEYQADSRVLAEGTDAASYQMLLIRKGASGVLANIANPFNYSSLKNRITMMQKKLSPSKSRRRALALLPAAALVLLISTSSTLASAVAEAAPAPEIIRDAVVNSSGEKMPLKSADTVVVVTAAPIPEVQADENIVTGKKQATKIYIRGIGTIGGLNAGKELVIVDGKEHPFSELQSIAANNKILAFNVNKSSDAIAKYGEKAKYGVIEVITEDAPDEMKPTENSRNPLKKLDKEKLVVVDGKTLTENEVAALDPNDIAVIQAIGNDKLVSKYGTRAANGVYLIETYSSQRNNQSITVAPSYPGGEPKLYEFLARSIRYPDEAVVNNAQGTVTVQFVVETDGSLSDFKVTDNPSESEALANESLRVAKLLPKFNPATTDGKAVRAVYTLPISYKMQ